MNLYSPKIIKEIRAKTGFKFSKSLGQNFLTDKNIIDTIVESSFIGEKDLVIEIGPGIGVITAEISQLAKKVIAIEIDKKLIPILERTLEDYNNIEVINKDILKTDLVELIREEREKDPEIENVRIIGNLPYYITTPIIMKILEDRAEVKSITIMMQKEVADRICAKEGTKARGALSVAVQYYCEVSKTCSVPKEVFMPIPKVDSTVLRLDLLEERPVDLENEKFFFKCVRAGFGQRRKTLSNSMSTLDDYEKEEIVEGLKAVGIDPQRRAETLSIDEFANISNKLWQIKKIKS